MASGVYFYIPNIIGYCRLVLLGLAWIFFESNHICLPAYCVSALLDAWVFGSVFVQDSISAFDGYFARKLQQTSAFGAWLDVLADNIGRTMLWSSVINCGWMVVCLEWAVFVCTHQNGERWKEEFATAPTWAKMVMANGFYTPVGVLTIAGIHGLPIALYYRIFPFSWFLLPEWIWWTVVSILFVGRCLGGAVELWVVHKHIQHLVEESTATRKC